MYTRGAYSRTSPHQQTLEYRSCDQVGIGFLIMLGLNSDRAGTNSAITHVMVLSAKVRRDEWSKQTVMANSRDW